MSVLAPEDLQALVESGLATPPRADGTIKLHRRRMNRSSDEENAHLPLQPISAASSGSCFSTIPVTLISRPTLLYLGFTAEKANYIWNLWTNWPHPREIDEIDWDNYEDPAGPMTFIDLILLRLVPANHRDDCSENDEEWIHFMHRCGINSELQTAIMDPRFRSVRLTKSCLYWLRDAIEIRYLGLQEIQAASREREMAVLRAHSRPSASQPSTRTSARRSISETIRERSGISIHTSTSEFALRAARTQPGYTILYRGISQTRMRNFREAEDAVKVDELSSPSPTDFLYREKGGYFALDRDVAIKYAQYAKNLHQDGPAVLLQFNVPNSAIESLPVEQLLLMHWDPSGNDKTWEKAVYYSRNSQHGPRDMRRAITAATLIIGTIATKPNPCYRRMRSYKEVDGGCVFMNRQGRPAVQYVFNGDEGVYFMEEHMIPIMQDFPVTSAELAALRPE